MKNSEITVRVYDQIYDRVRKQVGIMLSPQGRVRVRFRREVQDQVDEQVTTVQGQVMYQIHDHLRREIQQALADQS